MHANLLFVENKTKPDLVALLNGSKHFRLQRHGDIIFHSNTVFEISERKYEIIVAEVKYLLDCHLCFC